MAKIIDMIYNPDEVTHALVEKFGVDVRKPSTKKRPKKTTKK